MGVVIWYLLFANVVFIGWGCMGVLPRGKKKDNLGMDVNLTRYKEALQYRYDDIFTGHSSTSTPLDKFVQWQYCPTNRHYVNKHDKLAQRAPNIFERFDWVIWDTFQDFNIPKGDLPRVVLIRPDFFHRRYSGHNRHEKVFSCLPILSRSSAAERTLVISGDDQHLSTFASQIQIQYLKDRFSYMYISSKNIYSSDFRTVPLGLFHPYLLSAGYSRVWEAYNLAHSLVHPLMSHSDKVSRVSGDMLYGKIGNADHGEPTGKTKLALIAWGSKHPGLDRRIKSRQSLQEFVKEHTDDFSRSYFNSAEYWKQLPHYKFSFCPTGNGIQTPKIFEALLVRTVPVTLREPAFEDLVEYGFPILIVDSWNNITVGGLEHHYAETYEHTDWDRVEYLMSSEGVFDLLKNGTYKPHDAAIL